MKKTTKTIEQVLAPVTHHFGIEKIHIGIIWASGVEAEYPVLAMMEASKFAHYRFIEHLNSRYIVEDIECTKYPLKLVTTFTYKALDEGATLATYTETVTVKTSW